MSTLLATEKYFLGKLLLTCHLVIPSSFDWSTTASQIDQVATEKMEGWIASLAAHTSPHELHAHMLVHRPHHSSRTLNLL